jgi:hypothetical protein
MVMALLCLVLMTGCNNEKDKQIGKMEEQLKSLRFENARLKKEIVKTQTGDTGKDYTIITIAGIVFISCNLVWWVIARRRKDETLAE